MVLGLEIFSYFVQVAVGGPVFGYLMAKVTIFWLSRVYNDALVEIAITLASTYVTFYIGEQLLKVSGVLAVVTLGIEINSRKANISPEVEVFLHRYMQEVMNHCASFIIISSQVLGSFRLSCEYIDIHSCWSCDITESFSRRSEQRLDICDHSVLWKHDHKASWNFGCVIDCYLIHYYYAILFGASNFQ